MAYAQTRKRNNYLCVNYICTRVHNVPKFLSLSISLPRSLCEVTTASSQRRARLSYLRNRSRSLACVQTECIPVYTAECMRPRRIRIYVQPGVVYPLRRSLRIARITTTHILQLPSIPVRIMPFKQTAHLSVSIVVKRRDVMFFIGRKFFCLNKKKIVSLLFFLFKLSGNFSMYF